MVMWEALVGWHCSGTFSWSCSSICLGRNAIFKNPYISLHSSGHRETLKTQAEQTTKIKIQMENANQNHPSLISPVIWQGWPRSQIWGWLWCWLCGLLSRPGANALSGYSSHVSSLPPVQDNELLLWLLLLQWKYNTFLQKILNCFCVFQTWNMS